jgi:hypothetical protein
MIKQLLSFFMMGMMAVSAPVINVAASETTALAEVGPICGAPVETPFMAGQHITAGTITTYNTETHLVVVFSTTDGWLLKHTHLYVGDQALVPVNGAGNPMVGNFPYQTAHSPFVTQFAYTIALAELGECNTIATHAEVVKVDGNGNITQAETAWSSGTPFASGGGSWAMYNNYCNQVCPPPSNDICGSKVETPFMAGQHIEVGVITTYNTATDLVVVFQTTGDWYLNHTHLFVGENQLLATNGAGMPMIGLFPYQSAHSPLVQTYAYTIPLASLSGACNIIATHAEVVKLDSEGNIIQAETAWGSGTPFTSRGSWAMYNSYCIQECPPPSSNEPAPCVINAGDFRTQTQGGWGAIPQRNNPAGYMYNNFSAAFPAGITVGCQNYSITFTNPLAVTNFLPQGGEPQALSASHINPNYNINVLAGQVTALTISLGFDAAIPNYSSSNLALGSLVIGSGVFQGATVSQMLQIANDVLGGCNTNYTPSQVNEVISAINENFVDGAINNGYLYCVGTNNNVVLRKGAVEKVEPVQLYPNPAKEQVTLSLSEASGNIQIFIFDLKGKKLAEHNFFAQEGNAIFEINTSALQPGTYLLSVKGENIANQQKLVITH